MVIPHHKKLILILILFMFASGSKMSAQCHLVRISGTDYTLGNCSNFQFQSIVGTIFPVYGSCSSMYFDSPLTEGTDLVSTKTIANQFTIYPNPVANYLIVESIENQRILNFTILDYAGKEVSKGLITTNKETLYVGELTSGIYVIRFESQDKRQFQVIKFIKI